MLLNFTFQSVVECLFFCKLGEDIILNQLLRQSTCTLRKASGSKALHSRTGNTLWINPAVSVKTLVFNRNKSMLHIHRNLINRPIDPVRPFIHKPSGLRLIIVSIYNRSKSFRSDLRWGHLRRIINNILYK